MTVAFLLERFVGRGYLLTQLAPCDGHMRISRVRKGAYGLSTLVIHVIWADFWPEFHIRQVKFNN